MPTYGQITTGDRKQSGGTKSDARKIAPQPKSGGKSAPKSKRGYKKKNMDYWNKKKKKK